MSRHFVTAALHISAACLTLMLPLHSLAKESDPGGKDADSEAEVVFEPTSEGVAAAHATTDEKPIDFDIKRPSILGMTVVEGDNGKPEVVDVGASSPAWDAGIRKGDVILSLHGVQAKSFQEWAEGVRKVVADAKAGQTIPVEVLRDSSPIDLQVRISEQKGNKPPRPVRRQRPNNAINQAPPIAEQRLQQGGQPYPVGGGIGGFGVVDDGANDGTASDQAPTRAAAQLMAVNNRAGTAQPPTANGSNPAPRLNDATGTPPGSTGVASGTFPDNRNNPTDASGTVIDQGTTAAGTSGQVGTAEFADESAGMLVMVTLGGLPAGNYRVGIGEFSGGTSGAGNALPSNPQTVPSRLETHGRGNAIQLPGTQPPEQQPQPPIRPVPHSQSGARGTAPAPGGQPALPAPGAGAAPAGDGTGGAGGANSGGAAQVARPGYQVLAQVTPSVAEQRAADIGNVGAAARNQTQPARPQLNQRGQAIQPGTVPPTNPAAGTTGQFGIDLGVVSVRPNGGGTLKQRLEGIRVASVVGQSVLVVPADMSITNSAAGNTGANRNGRGQRDPRQPAAMQANGSLGVIAAGVIQMASTGPTANATQATNQNAPIPGTAQGTNVAQPAATGANIGQSVNRNQP